MTLDLADAPPALTQTVVGHYVLQLPTNETSTAKVMRDLTTAWLTAWGLREIAESAALAASEYVGNVKRHTDSPYVALRLTGYARAAMLEICDGGRPVDEVSRPIDEANDVLPDVALGGRGLELIAMLATQAWSFRNAAGPGETRVALFEL